VPRILFALLVSDTTFYYFFFLLRFSRLREYGAHIRCVTEDEKYGGLNYVKKPSAEKGLKKQESWLESIHNLVTSKGPELNPKVRQLLEAVAQYPNVPRKQAKFNNFCKTSLHCKDERLLAETWELVSGLQQKPNNNNNSADQAKSNGTTQNGKSDDKVEKTMETDEPAETETTKLSKREKKEQRRQQNDKVEKKDKKKRGAEEEMEVDEAPEKKRKRKMKDQHMEEADGENEEPETGSQADKKKKKKKKNKGDEVEGELKISH
jgi:cell growth-regulating nucleolar protein